MHVPAHRREDVRSNPPAVAITSGHNGCPVDNDLAAGRRQSKLPSQSAISPSSTATYLDLVEGSPPTNTREMHASKRIHEISYFFSYADQLSQRYFVNLNE